MRYNPFLSIKRLVVIKDRKRVYDESFKLGLNVIGGENGSGKTTIADFIFYALGGDLKSWRKSAASCDNVYAEVILNVNSITLRREVDTSSQRPLAVFWGTLDEALASDQSTWELYPYAAKGSKLSFSQILFKNFGLPEVRGDLSGRITMHQMLRLLYVDQTTPYDEVFRSDYFDQYSIREAVGDLLLGVYDEKIYQASLRLKDLDTENKALGYEIKAVHKIVGEERTVMTTDFLQQQRSTLISEREKCYIELKKTVENEEIVDKEIKKLQGMVADDLENANKTFDELIKSIKKIQVDYADTEMFLYSLRKRLESLEESDNARESLGAITFRFCPSCYSPLDEYEKDVCSVCGKPQLRDSERDNRLRMRHELEQQIEESEAHLNEQYEQLRDLKLQQPTLEGKRQALQLRYNELRVSAKSPTDIKRGELNRRIGYLDRELEDIEKRMQVALRIEELSKRREEIAAEVVRLKDEITAHEQAKQEREREVYNLIASLTANLLRRDLPREDEFTTARNITFDLGQNSVKIDGRANFAASSMVYLKNSFHFALLLASLELSYMRYPRFIVFDNVEDKGMEPLRSHNFQNLVRDKSKEANVDHQIIMFTTMISPDLSGSDYQIGEILTHDKKSLNL